MTLLRTSKAPALAPSPPLPTKGHLDSVLNVLRLYFTQLDNLVGAVVGRLGGKYLQFPQGAFTSRTTQSIAVINTPTRLTFDVTDYAAGVNYHTNNGIYVDQNGLYNVQFSMQLTNTDVQDHDAAIWLRIDGVDVPWSSSVTTVPSLHGGQPGYIVVAANFLVELLQGSYLEFWWAASNLAVQANALPPITTPFVNPGSPSMVATLTFVSNLE